MAKESDDRHAETAAQLRIEKAEALKDAEDAAKAKGDILELNRAGKPKSTMERLNDRKAGRFRKEWNWVIGFFVWLL